MKTKFVTKKSGNLMRQSTLCSMTREKEKIALALKKLKLVIELLLFGLFIVVENTFQVEEPQCNKRTYLYGIEMLLRDKLEKTENFT